MAKCVIDDTARPLVILQGNIKKQLYVQDWDLLQ